LHCDCEAIRRVFVCAHILTGAVARLGSLVVE
jgi:hypothetical protein